MNKTGREDEQEELTKFEIGEMYIDITRTLRVWDDKIG